MCVRREFGFSLIELLLSMTLGSIVLAALFGIYLGSKQLTQTLTELNAVQENIRFAATILRQNISVAGFAGCRKITEVNFVNHTGFDFSLANSIHGYASEHLPDYLEGKVVPQTDVIVIQTAAYDLTRVIAPVNKNTATVKVKQNPAQKNSLTLLIADCVNAELFTAKNYIGDSVVATSKFINAYDPGVTEVGRYEEVAYFIGDSGRLDAKGKPVYSLYVISNQGNRQELIANVISMQIKYGVAPNTIVSKYYTTSEMQSLHLWEKVRSVDICLQFAFKNGSKSMHFYIPLYERYQ